MKKISKCPKCGEELEYWEKMKVTRVYTKSREIKEEKDKIITNIGFQCIQCEWLTEGFR